MSLSAVCAFQHSGPLTTALYHHLFQLHTRNPVPVSRGSLPHGVQEVTRRVVARGDGDLTAAGPDGALGGGVEEGPSGRGAWGTGPWAGPQLEAQAWGSGRAWGGESGTVFSRQ